MNMTLLIGAPGSGKSTFAKTYSPTAVLSWDSFRERITDNPSNMQCSDDSFALMYLTAELRLRYGKDVVIDATNLNHASRGKWIDLAMKYGTTLNAVVFDTDVEDCVRNDKKRERVVGEDIVRHFAARMPDVIAKVITEPFDSIFIGRVLMAESQNPQGVTSQQDIDAQAQQGQVQQANLGLGAQRATQPSPVVAPADNQAGQPEATPAHDPVSA